MLRGLTDRGMTPLVTLHHFTDPLWLFERGGWENPETPALFEKFVRRVVDALREYCTTWIPINEPNVYVYGGYLGGGFPPGKNDMNTAFAVMTQHGARAWAGLPGDQIHPARSQGGHRGQYALYETRPQLEPAG